MSAATATKSTVAFFGATGGSTNAALVLALQNGHTCAALARTPSKLRDMLIAASVPASTLDAQLTIIQGDARDASAASKVVSSLPGGGCDIVVSGIGSYPGKNYDGTLCREAMAATIQGIAEAKLARKPALVAISTTGITAGARDVPLLLVPLYHVLLKSPHQDKAAMEQVLLAAVEEGGEKGEAPISGYTIVRPTLLTDRESKGFENIQCGTEAKPELGYLISRKDVGLWIYKETIEGDVAKWRNTKPSLSTCGGLIF